MTEEQKKKISETLKARGIKPPVFKGMKFSEEHKRNLSKSLKGRVPWNKGKKIDKSKYPNMGHLQKHTPEGIENLKKNHKGMTGKKHKKETIEKIILSQKGKPKPRGKLSNNWKGGVTNKNKVVRGLIEYKQWRKSVFERDNYTCQKCGEKGKYLHPHHIKNFSSNKEIRFNVDNGITLCKKCHLTFHKIYGFNNNNKQQCAFYFSNKGDSNEPFAGK